MTPARAVRVDAELEAGVVGIAHDASPVLVDCVAHDETPILLCLLEPGTWDSLGQDTAPAPYNAEAAIGA